MIIGIKCWHKKAPRNEEIMGNLSENFANTAARLNLPSIILGIGVQVEFDGVADISTLTMDGYDSYKRVSHEFESRQKPKSIAVRGDVTER